MKSETLRLMDEFIEESRRAKDFKEGDYLMLKAIAVGIKHLVVMSE